jgi:hypothetical protein
VGLRVVTGETDLWPSNNAWDWLGDGIYFWEYNPERALEYGEEVKQGRQFNKIPISNPLVIGAIIELGTCLNLVEPQSLHIIRQAYSGLVKMYGDMGLILPVNKGANRALDCAVFNYLHQSAIASGQPPYDTVRCPFSEGSEVYPGASFSIRSHIQVCVRNDSLIRAYFLPRPVDQYNPYLKRSLQ